MTTQEIFSNTIEVNLEQIQGDDLTLKLRGEVANANDLRTILHKAYATNANGSAYARGLHKSNLGTRNLEDVTIDVRADAVDGPNFAYGFQSMLFEGERNLNGINLSINAEGSTRSSADPTFGDSPTPPPNDDPSFGFNNSSTYFSEYDDVISVNVSAEAGDWTNQAVAYGIRGGNSKVDKVSLEELNPGSNLRSLRPSLLTFGGNDLVEFTVQAKNTGQEYDVPLSEDASEGRQRAVGLFQAIADLGEGDDFISVSTGFEIGSISGKGAENLRFQNDFFGGSQSTSQDEFVAASVDFYESAIILGEGDDTVLFHNAWESDIWLDEGNDTLTLSAGKNLFIHGGDGDDSVNFVDDNVTYDGVEKAMNKFTTSEGSVFINTDIENVLINGEEVRLSNSDVIDPEPQPTPDPGTDPGKDCIQVEFKYPTPDGIIEGTNESDKLKGSKQNDLIYGFDENDKLKGGKGSDELRAGKGVDKLNGGNGSDILIGGKGDDILKGGNGADIFYMSKGQDTIKDFKYQQGDRIGVVEISCDGFSFEEVGSDVLVKLTTGYSIMIEDQDIDSLDKTIELFRVDPAL